MIADPMQDNVPEYKDVPYQVITTSRGTLTSKRRCCWAPSGR